MASTGVPSLNSTIDWKEVLNANRRDLNTGHALPMIALGGLAILLRDCVSLFRQERDHIWSKPPSFTKYSYLFNKFLVPLCFLVMFLTFSGFRGIKSTDNTCFWTIAVVATIFPCSLALGNILIIARVVHLWDHNRTILKVLGAAFVLTLGPGLVLLVLGLKVMKAGITFDPNLRICVASTNSQLIIPATVAPMVFELLALALMYWNTLDRPRAQATSLRTMLMKDGLSFFVYINFFKVLQVALVSIGRPSVTILGFLIVWTGVHVALNRHLISLYKAGLEPSLEFRSAPRARHPQPRLQADKPTTRISTEWQSGETIELGQVAVETFRD